MDDMNECIDEGDGESDYFSVASATRSFSGLSDDAGGNWTPRALPDAPNADGRPAWEPPILDYSLLIGEEHEKKREAVLEHTGGDVAKTTDIMDVDTEEWLLAEYCRWAGDTARSSVDNESRRFFVGLRTEVFRDWGDVWDEWRDREDGIEIVRNEDGTYRIFDWQSDDDFELEDDVGSDDSTQSFGNRVDSSICPPIPTTSKPNNNKPSITRDKSTDHHRRISSHTDESTELTGLGSMDASASKSGQLTMSSAPSQNATPLALRLVSLHSKIISDDTRHKRNKTTEYDDVD